jgi:hypothetical protein
MPYFPLPAWSAWRASGAALYGLPMSAAERAVYATATGRQEPPTARAREAWVICGRRSGKSRTNVAREAMSLLPPSAERCITTEALRRHCNAASRARRLRKLRGMRISVVRV